jgi:hypothetical protein
MSKVVKSIGKAVTGVVKGVVNVVKGVVKAVGKVVGAVVDIVGQAFLGIFGSPNIPDAAGEAERQQGVLVQREGSNVTIPVIYGYRKVGGIVTFAETGSDNNKYMWAAYVFSEGLVEGLNELHIDDNQIDKKYIEQLNTGETVTVTDGRYANRIVMKWSPGNYYANPSSSTLGQIVRAGVFAGSPSFTDNMIYNGLATLFVRYEWRKIETQADSDNNPFTGGVPQMQACILGKRVVGLATKSFTGASNSINNSVSNTMLSAVNSYWDNNTAYDSNAGRYSTNPVEILHDYLRNPRYGKGMVLSEMDKTTWINAANKCNQNVTYYTGAVGPILSCNYVLDTGQTLFSNVKALLSGFRAYMPYVQGKYKLKIEDAGNEIDVLSSVADIVTTAVPGSFNKLAYEFNTCDIVGDVVYTGIERTSKYNQVAVTYVDPDQKWSNQIAVWPRTEAERQVFIAEDGGRENKADITMGSITNAIMALDMARLIFNKSRYQESCSLKISSEGFELEPGDNMRIRSNLLDFADVAWRVVSIKLNNDYTFDLGCIRNNALIYPYITYDAPDIVRPTFIPRGNEIYFPGSNNPLIGIFPPTFAPFPAGWSGNLPVGYFPPTNPTTGGTGGGTGSPGAPTNTTPGTSTPIPPPVVTTNDVITPISANFNTTNSTWTVTFQRPTAGTYNGVKVWYRPQTTTTFLALPDVGPGLTTFSFQAAADFNLVYSILTRVKYSNGDLSTASASFQLSRTSGLVGVTTSQNFNFGSVQTQSVDFVNLAAQPYVVSYTFNTATNPRSATLIVKEPLISGQIGSTTISQIYIYYKPSSSPGYNLFTYTTPDTYAPNTEFTVNMANLFGTTNALYDFIVQFKFRNGQMGNLQYLQRNVPNSGISTGIASSNSVARAITVPLASAGAPVNETVPVVTAIVGQNRTNMRVYVDDPVILSNMTSFAGIMVEYALLTAGSTISYVSTFRTVNQLQKVFGGVWPTSYFVDVPLTSTLTQNYNVIVTLFYFENNVITPCTVGRKFVGRFLPTSNVDQLPNFSMINQTSYNVLKADNGTGAVVPGLPAGANAIVPSALNAFIPAGNIVYTTDEIKVPTLQISFNSSTITGFTKLRVFRKLNSQSVWEWTDLTTTGVFRFPSIYSLVLTNGARQINPTGVIDLYLQVWTSTASTFVTKVTVTPTTVRGAYSSVLGATEIVDLSQNLPLLAALSNAQRAFPITIQYNIHQTAFGDPNTATGNFN